VIEDLVLAAIGLIIVSYQYKLHSILHWKYGHQLTTAMHQGGHSHERHVRPSVRLSNAWIVIKQKKLLPTVLYHMKDWSS